MVSLLVISNSSCIHVSSWLVWSVLTALDYSHMHGTTEAQLLVGLANQMARCGKWQWSIFSLLHLKDAVLCQDAVERVLAHSCSPEEELVESEVFVVERLKVPKEWVYRAKAQRAGYEQWHDLKALHLLLSCQWNEAHLEIVDHLAVDAIITGRCMCVCVVRVLFYSPTSIAIGEGVTAC